MEMTVLHIKKSLIYFSYMENKLKFVVELTECLTKTVHTYLRYEKVNLEEYKQTLYVWDKLTRY